MNDDVQLKVLDYLEATGEAMAAAKQLASAEIARRDKVAALVPRVLGELVNARLVREEDQEAFRQKLATHDGALSLVTSLINWMKKHAAAVTKPAAAQLGAPEETRKRRAGGGERSEADRIFEQRLGLL